MTEIEVLDVEYYTRPDVPVYSPPAVFEEAVGTVTVDTFPWRSDELRAAFLDEYGGCCACCGEDTPRFLTLDHIYNDGAKERRELTTNPTNFLRYLCMAGWPKDRYRILCFNCNCGRQYNGGVCPHEEMGTN